eukprot:scaffold968_cov171-Amphora_coffeaeformis.AAC.11
MEYHRLVSYIRIILSSCAYHKKTLTVHRRVSSGELVILAQVSYQQVSSPIIPCLAESTFRLPVR